MIKISQKEKFIGWYTTGDSFKAHDVQINEVFRKYTDKPIFLVVDVEHSVRIKIFRMSWDFPRKSSSPRKKSTKRPDQSSNLSSTSSPKLRPLSLKRSELSIFSGRSKRFLLTHSKAASSRRYRP